MSAAPTWACQKILPPQVEPRNSRLLIRIKVYIYSQKLHLRQFYSWPLSIPYILFLPSFATFCLAQNVDSDEPCKGIFSFSVHLHIVFSRT